MAGEGGCGGRVYLRAAEGSDGQIARIGNNLNQLARWANTHKTATEAVTVIAHLVSFERSLLAVARIDREAGDAR